MSYLHDHWHVGDYRLAPRQCGSELGIFSERVALLRHIQSCFDAAEHEPLDKPLVHRTLTIALRRVEVIKIFQEFKSLLLEQFFKVLGGLFKLPSLSH